MSHVFGPYLRIFFSGITQRPVLQEKGPPQGRGSYKKREKGKAYKISCLYLSTMNIEYFQSRRYINIVNGLSQRQLPGAAGKARGREEEGLCLVSICLFSGNLSSFSWSFPWFSL